jgi:hypothetical protein
MTATYTVPDNPAQSWRDLADQLTPQQIAEMEYCEREGIPPGLTSPQHQLNAARAMARHNIIQALCADITPPAEAVAGEAYEWEERENDRFGRMYGTPRVTSAPRRWTPSACSTTTGLSRGTSWSTKRTT